MRRTINYKYLFLRKPISIIYFELWESNKVSLQFTSQDRLELGKWCCEMWSAGEEPENGFFLIS